MERLTNRKTKTLEYSEENNIILRNERNEKGEAKPYFYGKPIERLAELEDFMEDYGFVGVEEFKRAISFMQSMNNIGAQQFKEAQELKTKNEILEQAFDLMSLVLCTGARNDLKRQISKLMFRSDVKDFFIKEAEKDLNNNRTIN